MSYQIEFFNQQVKTLIEAWPTGIAASFVRITEQMVVTGPNLGMPYTKAIPNTELKIARKKLKEISNA
jgi:hypothetical protein